MKAKKQTKPKAKKRNPADTTMRNINALKERIARIEVVMKHLLVLEHLLKHPELIKDDN